LPANGETFNRYKAGTALDSSGMNFSFNDRSSEKESKISSLYVKNQRASEPLAISPQLRKKSINSSNRTNTIGRKNTFKRKNTKTAKEVTI